MAWADEAKKRISDVINPEVLAYDSKFIIVYSKEDLSRFSAHPCGYCFESAGAFPDARIVSASYYRGKGYSLLADGYIQALISTKFLSKASISISIPCVTNGKVQ